MKCIFFKNFFISYFKVYITIYTYAHEHAGTQTHVLAPALTHTHTYIFSSVTLKCRFRVDTSKRKKNGVPKLKDKK